MTGEGWTGFALAILVSGFLRGFTGFGFSMAAVPLTSLVMPPAAAIPVAVLLQMAIGAVGLRDAIRLADCRAVAVMAAGAAVGTPVGVALLARLDANAARLAIAALLLGAVVLLGRGVRLRRRPGPAGIAAVGLAAGLANGLAGVPGPPVVAYFVAARVAPEVARASMILFFLLTSLFAAASLLLAGLLTTASLWPTAMGVPLVFAGSWAGTWMFQRSGGRHHDRVALFVLAMTACASLGKALA